MAAIILAVFLAASAHADPGGTIALVVHKTEGFHNAFWDALQTGARKEAERLGYELLYRGIPQADESDRVGGQIRLMQGFADSGVKGILITPIDRIRLAGAVKYAIVRGVPVVAVDSAVDSTLLSGIVATGNYQGSLEATRFLVRLMGAKGKVAMLVHPSRENRATRDRELAFLAGIKEFGPSMTLVSADTFGDATIPGDTKAALALLDRFPDLEAVYCVNGTGTRGFLQALESRKLLGKVRLVGWDADPVIIEALRKGHVQAVVQQDPETMGKEAVVQLHQALSGSPARFDIVIQSMLITRDSMDNAQARRLLEPDTAGWVR